MKLSVALCTYNGSRYIEKQILSIINQTKPVDEIVICDDGSTDNTILIINDLKEKNCNFNFLIHCNEYNLGIRKNFEKAISLCTGDIIFLSDQDDIWLPHKTESIVNYLNKNPHIDLVFTNAILIDENDNIKTEYTLFDATGINQLKNVWNAGLQFEIENVEQRLLGSTFGIRKDFALSCLPFNSKVTNYHDGQLAMYAVMKNCIGMLPLKLIKYRLHSNNTVGLKNNWVFGTAPRPDNFIFLIEPRPIKPFFTYSNNHQFKKRVDFYKKRYNNYHSISGKLLLLFSILQYIKYYNKYWWSFYYSDVTYGFKSFFKSILKI